MLKQRVKAALRPYLRPALKRVDQRIDWRIANASELGIPQLQQREASMATELEDVRRMVPALLDALSTANSATRNMKRQEKHLWDSVEAAERRIAAVEQRVEQSRRELLFELRYGGHERGALQEPQQPRIIDQPKVDSMSEELRVNLGCGAFPMEGYVNVDVRELDGVDVVADLRNLPFDTDQVAEIFSSHVLEHFPEEELARRMFPYWVSLLRPGGVFRAVVPDAETMMRYWNEERMPFRDLRLATFGEQEYEGDFHFTMFTPSSLGEHLERAGLEQVEVLDHGRRNGICYEMEVSGRKPASRVS